jgi:hypothetical protein
MRLIVNHVDKEFYDREYGTFREIGRIMCSWRDTSVQRKILKDLKKANPEIFSKLSDNPKIEMLLRRNDLPPKLSPELRSDLDKINELLSKTGYRIRFQTLNNFDPKLLLKELDTSYIIVTDKYLSCRNSMKPSDLHEFRKRAKDFLYQLWFFRPLNPSVAKSVEKKLDLMTQNLGKYNDLDQLIKTLVYKYSFDSGSPALDELIIVIRKEQDRYLSKVWPVAYKIFCPGQNLVNVLGFKLLII